MSSGDSENVTNRLYVENWVYKGGVKKNHVRCLPPLYIYRHPLLTSPLYIGEVNSGNDFFNFNLIYIPNFTLISDLVSDLGVISGLFRVT